MIFSKLENTIKLLQNTLQENKETIKKSLIKVESFKTIMDEFDRVESLLRNIHKQAAFLLSAEVERTAVYLPQNQPLYSLFLFGIIPSLLSKKIFIRPPVLLAEPYTELVNCFSRVIENLILSDLPRKVFFEEVTAFSQVVIFSGKYNNVNSLCNQVSRDTLLLFNGSSSNPCIIGKDAELTSAVGKCTRAQCYNSGQDCMAPRMIIIHEDVYNKFSSMLSETLGSLLVGDYLDEQTDIGPLISMESYLSGVKFLQKNQANIAFGGQFEQEKRIIFPTLMHFDALEALPMEEVFAPIFRLVKYSDMNSVVSFLNTLRMRNIAGYIAYFGSEIFAPIRGYQIINNDSIQSLDDGNEPFGGSGVHASFVKIGDYQKPQPILISQEVARFFGKEG